MMSYALMLAVVTDGLVDTAYIDPELIRSLANDSDDDPLKSRTSVTPCGTSSEVNVSALGSTIDPLVAVPLDPMTKVCVPPDKT